MKPPRPLGPTPRPPKWAKPARREDSGRRHAATIALLCARFFGSGDNSTARASEAERLLLDFGGLNQEPELIFVIIIRLQPNRIRYALHEPQVPFALGGRRMLIDVSDARREALIAFDSPRAPLLPSADRVNTTRYTRTILTGPDDSGTNSPGVDSQFVLARTWNFHMLFR